MSARRLDGPFAGIVETLTLARLWASRWHGLELASGVSGGNTRLLGNDRRNSVIENPELIDDRLVRRVKEGEDPAHSHYCVFRLPSESRSDDTFDDLIGRNRPPEGRDVNA